MKMTIGYQSHADTATKSGSTTKNKFVVWETPYVPLSFPCLICCWWKERKKKKEKPIVYSAAKDSAECNLEDDAVRDDAPDVFPQQQATQDTNHRNKRNDRGNKKRDKHEIFLNTNNERYSLWKRFKVLHTLWKKCLVFFNSGNCEMHKKCIFLSPSFFFFSLQHCWFAVNP